MKNKLFGNIILSVFALLGAHSILPYTHYLTNKAPFDLYYSVDFMAGFGQCGNSDNKVLPAWNPQDPGKSQVRINHDFPCTLTNIVVWAKNSPEAKAVGGEGKDSKWNHNFVGDGSWEVTWDSNSKQLKVDQTHSNSLGNMITTTATNVGNQIATTAKDVGNTIVNEVLLPAASVVGTELSKLVNSFETNTPPPFCYNQSNMPPKNPIAENMEITIDDQSVKDQDTERLIPTIQKYSPVLYLAPGEYAWPIKVAEYIMNPATEIRNVATDALVVPAGKVTPEVIYNLWKQDPNQKIYFKVPDCVTRGSNPDLNHNPDGSLNTPIYVQTFTYNNKLYIRYIFIFGFNAPYPIVNLLGLFGNKQKAKDTANAHIADIEHITYELDPKTKELLRIYYGSHGSTEGFWLNAHDPAVSYQGSHPVVYLAKGGHGAYPEAKTYVRVYGFANDITGNGTRWVPRLVRIYYNDDPRFLSIIDGWTYHAGQWSKDGVGSVHAQFGPNLSGDAGNANRTYQQALKCNPGDNGCVTTLGTKATPPE